MYLYRIPPKSPRRTKIRPRLHPGWGIDAGDLIYTTLLNRKCYFVQRQEAACKINDDALGTLLTIERPTLSLEFQGLCKNSPHEKFIKRSWKDSHSTYRHTVPLPEYHSHHYYFFAAMSYYFSFFSLLTTARGIFNVEATISGGVRASHCVKLTSVTRSLL